MKVSKRQPDSKHTLQLLMYYILGINSIHEEFKSITKLGIFNLRHNEVYQLEIDKIDNKEFVMYDVTRYVMLYENCELANDLFPQKKVRIWNDKTELVFNDAYEVIKHFNSIEFLKEELEVSDEDIKYYPIYNRLIKYTQLARILENDKSQSRIHGYRFRYIKDKC